MRRPSITIVHDEPVAQRGSRQHHVSCARSSE